MPDQQKYSSFKQKLLITKNYKEKPEIVNLFLSNKTSSIFYHSLRIV